MICRNCSEPLNHSIMDLGTAPPSNSYLTAPDLLGSEAWYPLELRVCTTCWLVQLGENVDRGDMFNSEYAYFSSTSESFVAHAKTYVETMIARFNLGSDALVAEIASNDGYLLQHVQNAGIACYGVEPTASTAQAAREVHGLEVVEEFFGTELGAQLAKDGKSVDLVAANNVLAHVPDIRDFMTGFAHLLKPGGVATFEFPSVVELVKRCAFDTIYHEHYSYLSLSFLKRLTESCGLRVFDVAHLPVHGGSLRVFVTHAGNSALPTSQAVKDTLAAETDLGVETTAFYASLAARAETCKNALIRFLIDAKDQGKTVVAYGAAAKGNTFLNWAGIKPDLLPCVVDAAPSKQDKYMPGSRIPIRAPSAIAQLKPDYLLILPWNISDEVMQQQAGIADWGGQFVTAIPELKIVKGPQA